MTKKKSSAIAEPTPFEEFKQNRIVLSTGNYAFYRQYYAGEPGGGESRTVPGQNMPLEEILLKFAHGLPMDSLIRPADYTEDAYIPNFRAMDPVEVMQYREDLFEQQRQLIATMDAATRQIAINDGTLPDNINDLYPLPPEPPAPPAEPPAQT